MCISLQSCLNNKTTNPDDITIISDTGKSNRLDTSCPPFTVTVIKDTVPPPKQDNWRSHYPTTYNGVDTSDDWPYQYSAEAEDSIAEGIKPEDFKQEE